MKTNLINIAVAGATGFVGLDLVYLLTKHPKVKILKLCSKKNTGKQIQIFDKRIKKKLPKLSKIEKVSWDKIDLLFLSLPNGEAQKLVKKLYYNYPKLRFIDLSADFRLKKSKNYYKWYKRKHLAKNLIQKSVYSIAEFSKKKIKNQRLISNPGCYPTSILLALVPVIKKNLLKIRSIIIDSKSGFSGAGKHFSKKFNYKNLYDSTFAYNVSKHRHIAEIDEELKRQTNKLIKYTFTPHVIPTYRGILSSIHIETSKKPNLKKLVFNLRKFYQNDKFVKVLDLNQTISTGNVINTNFCYISVCQTRYNNRVIIFSSIDNLIKGACGQAIQNMNLIYNLNKNIGLK
tara:strand:- start:261 stop:1295 length:1035 start_codon:yes stop_codon:yes gene_type:complete